MTKKTWAFAVGLVVAFAAGWLGAEIRNVNKVPLAEVFAREWQTAVLTLVQNGHSNKLIDPAKMPWIIGSGLDNSSVQLALTYDDLSPTWKKRVAFDLPAARAIAGAGGRWFPYYRGHLQIFVDCVQQVQAQGGSVRKCALGNKWWKGGGLPAPVLLPGSTAPQAAANVDAK